MNLRSLLIIALVPTLLVGIEQSAYAVTANGTSDNSASVAASCKTPTTATLSFGTYNPILNTALDSTTTINIRCTNNTPITSVALNGGTAGGSISQRKMQLTGATTNKLNYQLYKDTNRSTVWGDGTTGSTYTGLTGAGLNTDVTITVYGRIPAGQQTAKPGSYSDSITVTVTY